MKKKSYNIDLSMHLAECDANYVRLQRLFVNMGDCDVCEYQLAHAGQVVSITFQVLERCPYTTIVHIKQTVLGSGLDFELSSPSITVRVYHDTRSIEVVEIQNQDRFRPVYSYPNQKMRQQDEKVQVNRFLGEYLAFCLEQGLAMPETTQAYLREPADRR